MLDYQASLQLSRKHGLYCVLSKAGAASSHAPCVDTEASAWSSPFRGVGCPWEGHCGETHLDCFIAVVFFISEIVLFNILNKILRNKW